MGDKSTRERDEVRRGEVVAPDDIKLGELPVFAYPMDPESETVRDGTRLNQIILVRLDPAVLDAETAARSADGSRHPTRRRSRRQSDRMAAAARSLL